MPLELSPKFFCSTGNWILYITHACLSSFISPSPYLLIFVPQAQRPSFHSSNLNSPFFPSVLPPSLKTLPTQNTPPLTTSFKRATFNAVSPMYNGRCSAWHRAGSRINELNKYMFRISRASAISFTQPQYALAVILIPISPSLFPASPLFF